MPENQTTPDSTQTGQTEGGAGESALDQLLTQFEKAGEGTTEASAPKPDTVALRALKPVVDFAQQAMEKDRTEGVQKDLDSAVEFVSQAEELKGIKSDVAIGMLEAYGRQDPGFVKAFEQRTSDPAAWNKALESGRDWVKEALADYRGGGGNKVRDDIEAATAAVQGTVTQAEPTEGPSAVEMNQMSDVEWDNFKADLRAKANA